MVELINEGAYLVDGEILVTGKEKGTAPFAERLDEASGRKGTMAYQIFSAHNTSGSDQDLQIRFDALTSHDITFVGIIQTAMASGLKEFPVPYVLTNCHNSLCAVGGTINEDDHVFGYSAAKKYGGIFVPTHQAVIHQYMREMMAGCGKMILGSDSHTRYGALGTMAIGEGGGELVKQLLKKTYDVQYPGVIAVYLEGAPVRGVGPQDVALTIVKAVFKSGFVKNKVMEFVGPGIKNLTVDFRNGIDVMTTETTCLSSIWRTDEKVAEFYAIHGRPAAYREMKPAAVAYYDGVVKVDLSRIEPMIALPFHPSNGFTISELNSNLMDILHQVEVEAKQQLENPNLQFSLTDKIVNGRLKVDQGVVAGCAGGTFENVVAMNAIMKEKPVADFPLSVYPSSQPVFLELLKNGSIEGLTISGASIRSAFCGPCFGAGDVPANGALSIRHTTRNFPNREGSKPIDGQISSVALMDARSIAATAISGGFLTAATEIDFDDTKKVYHFNKQVYDNRVYEGAKKAQPEEKLIFGPNIVPWPKMRSLPENLLLQVASVIHDPVTTTDELIPSGETSSYRSNPLRLAEFTLSRKDPEYVGRAKDIQKIEVLRQSGQYTKEVAEVFAAVQDIASGEEFIKNTGLGSVIFARKPGDGSAREQAASCQKVLGGDANIALEYATKRYRSNLINWGMVPFTLDDSDKEKFTVSDFVFIKGIRKAIAEGAVTVDAYIISGQKKTPVRLKLENLSASERDIILAGCLINYYNKA